MAGCCGGFSKAKSWLILVRGTNSLCFQLWPCTWHNHIIVRCTPLGVLIFRVAILSFFGWLLLLSQTCKGMTWVLITGLVLSLSACLVCATFWGPGVNKTNLITTQPSPPLDTIQARRGEQIKGSADSEPKQDLTDSRKTGRACQAKPLKHKVDQYKQQQRS